MSHLQIVFDRLKDGAIPLPSKRDTPPHNRIANGLCERFHRSMKAALRASLKDDSWCEQLPWVLLGIRTTPKEDLQSSSVELVYRQPLRCLETSSPMPPCPGLHPPVLHPPEQFGMLSIDFLGRHITNDGAIPLPSKVATVSDFP
ncbi:hypothetical protein AAFF_G00209350 [Aldrovandia affinis]|uniref:Integrase catalytic domain-containing protein n=1 Tax=Aldrovandia affinis TaxID=143900 RepID=A0AAD7SW41_9TELE|nr:hypothetical protein AAFF_G00209350 [Aldrovandia affinis]